MKDRYWTVDRIKQSFVEQGAQLGEAELHEKSVQLEQEMRRWDIRWHNRQRAFYRNELPSGLPAADDRYQELSVLDQLRLRRENWGERTAPGAAVKRGVQPGLAAARSPSVFLTQRSASSDPSRRGGESLSMAGQ